MHVWLSFFCYWISLANVQVWLLWSQSSHGDSTCSWNVYMEFIMFIALMSHVKHIRKLLSLWSADGTKNTTIWQQTCGYCISNIWIFICGNVYLIMHTSLTSSFLEHIAECFQSYVWYVHGVWDCENKASPWVRVDALRHLLVCLAPKTNWTAWAVNMVKTAPWVPCPEK